MYILCISIKLILVQEKILNRPRVKVFTAFSLSTNDENKTVRTRFILHSEGSGAKNINTLSCFSLLVKKTKKRRQ